MKLPSRAVLLGLLCLVSLALIAYGYYDPTLQRNRGLGRAAPRPSGQESMAGDLVLCDGLMVSALQAHLHALLPDRGLRVESRFAGPV